MAAETCWRCGSLRRFDILDPASYEPCDYCGDTSPTNGRAVEKAGRGSMKYRTIVVDPPWDQGPTGHSNTRGFGSHRHRVQAWETRPPYQSMSLNEISALPVANLAEPDAHLYLWTTQKFLESSFVIARAWSFRVAATLVWCKQPGGIAMGGPWASTIEFVHFCRRGNLKAVGRVDRQWFAWPRRRGAPVREGEMRQIMHSAKPEAFVDLVERVSPGPYLELFARRNRLGWDTWGNEALEHVEMPQ